MAGLLIGSCPAGRGLVLIKEQWGWTGELVGS